MLAAVLIAAAAIGPPQTAPEAVDGTRLEGTVLVDGYANVDGGLEQDRSTLFLLRGSVIVAGHPLGWPGLRLNLTALATGGRAPGSVVGDIQGTSNIAASRGIHPYEAWIQQNLGGRVSVLAGLYDVNSEFDAIEAAGVFLNSSFGIGPDFSLAGPNGPGTFPTTGLAVRVAAAPWRRVRARLVLMDGTPGDPRDPGAVDLAWRPDDGAMAAGEAVYLFGRSTNTVGAPQGGRRFLGRGADAPSTGKLALGVWRFAGVPLAPDSTRPRGAYVLAERRLGRSGTRALAVFARAGVAVGGPVGTYVGAGVQSRGWPGRSGDAAGLGVAIAWPNAGYDENGPPSLEPETVLEFTYRINVSTRLFVQPDVQYVLNPRYGEGTDRAVVVMLRGALLY